MEIEIRSDLQKLKDQPKFQSLQMEEPRKRNLLLILYGLDSSIIARGFIYPLSDLSTC